jgi:hypothetical protein
MGVEPSEHIRRELAARFDETVPGVVHDVFLLLVGSAEEFEHWSLTGFQWEDPIVTARSPSARES